MEITSKSTVFTIAQYGNYETFLEKFSIQDINQKSKYGSSLLHGAIAGKNFDIALFLIKSGIDVNMVNSDGQTALHHICVYPNINVAKEILKSGGDVSIKDKYGNIPLWIAVFNAEQDSDGRYELIDLLMKNGSDPNSKNNVGKTPLDIAARKSEKLQNMLKKTI